MRESLESVERQTGKRPSDLDGPGLGDHLIPAWTAFCELSARRSSNGFGVNPLSWMDIAAWVDISQQGQRPSAWIVDAIMALDDAFLKYVGEQEKKRQQSKRPAG